MLPLITTLDELIMYTGHIYYPGNWSNSLFATEAIADEPEAEEGTEE